MSARILDATRGLGKRRALALGGGVLGIASVGMLASLVAPGIAAGAVGGALFASVAALVLKSQASVEGRLRELEGALTQVEPMIALAKFVDARRPLPPMTEYAIAPDFALLLYELVCDTKPRVIVETGSGVSTLICAYALERAGSGGRVVALDHDARYADKTRALLAQHGLADRATVIHAPLEEVAVRGEPVLWYRSAALEGIDAIDLVVDDGPPKYVGANARYASLPVLAPKLRPGAPFVLDYVGDEEKAMIPRWCRELGFEAEWLTTHKGNVVLRRKEKA